MSSPKHPDPYTALDALAISAIPAAIGFLSAKLMAAPAGAAPNAAPAPDELLDPTQAAKLLHVSRKFVYSNVRALGGVRLGKGPRARLRFKRSVILARVSR
jgi:hypothetical protein